LAFRANAALATRGSLPRSLRDAELHVVTRLFATCEGRVTCLGRSIDTLRRLGYLGVLERAPDVVAALARARDRIATLPDAERYQTLVALTLAMPDDIGLQWQLLKLRRKLASLPAPFPPLD
jgi:hypothetical protein